MLPTPAPTNPSVTYGKASSHADWDRLRPIITYLWLHESRNLKDLVNTLRSQHGLPATEKTCRIRLQRWGLSTYKKSSAQAGQDGSAQPVRTRKGCRFLQRQARLEQPVGQGLASFSLTRAAAYQSSELVLYSVDQFIYAFFQDSTPRFNSIDLIRPRFDADYCLCWQGIADLYNSSEGYFRGGHVRKFANKIKQAHLELRLLVSLLAHPCKEVQQLHHHMMVSRFWRICHALLILDRAWPQFEYSFVLDFLLEFQKLMSKSCGHNHPLYQLLFALTQGTKAEMHAILRLGVERTIWVMGPALNQRQSRMVFRYWTSHIKMG